MAYQTKTPLRYAEDPDEPRQRQLAGYVDEGPPASTETPNAQAPTGDQGGGNGRWINFARYWDQNRNQAGDMATALTNKANERAGSTQAHMAQAMRTFGQAVNQGTVRDDGSNIAAAKYTGPSSLTEAQGYADLDQQVNRAAENVTNLQDTYGVQAELQDMYGGAGNYTAGGSLLDAGLAQTAGAGAFKGVKDRWGGLLGQLADAKAEAAKAGAGGLAASQSAVDAYNARMLAGEDVDPADTYAPVTDASKAAELGEAKAEGLANDEIVVSSTDETLASQQGDAVLSAWERAGKPSFDNWFSGIKQAWAAAGSPQPFAQWLQTYLAAQGY